MAAPRVSLLPLLVLPLLLSAALPACAGFTQVSVNITGPDEGWVTDNLEYDAHPSWTVDAETAAKISNNEAFVTASLMWNYYPATAVAGGGPSDPTATLSYANASAGWYSVSVAYLCSITYQGGGMDYGYAQSSKPVKIKRLMMMAAPVGGNAICVGAKDSAPHKITITASVIDGFGPVSGKTVHFNADSYAFAYQAPVVNPTSAATDQYGNASTVLTSGDGVTNGAVQVTCEGLTSWATVNFEAPETIFDIVDPETNQPLQYFIADGESESKVRVHLTHGGANVPDHTLQWRTWFWLSDNQHMGDEAQADYQAGTGEAPYGSITPAEGATGADGIAFTVYTSSTVAGYVRFKAYDQSVYVEQ